MPATRKIAQIGIAVVMGIIILLAFIWLFYTSSTGNYTSSLKLLIANIGMIFAMILFINCCFNSRGNLRQGKILTAISALLFLTLLISGIQDALDGVSDSGTLLFVLETICSIVVSIIQLLFWMYQCESLPHTRAQRYYSWWIIANYLVYFVIIIINIFNGMLFYVNESNQLTWSGYSIEIIIALVFYMSYLIYILPQKCSLKKKLALASFAVFPMFAFINSIVWNLIGGEINILSAIYVFLLLAAYVVFFWDYRDYQDLLIEKQAELRTQLMLSQIRPHFLYNSLTAIRNLCKTDPDEAYRAIGLFAEYLRANMDSIGGGRIIPFEKELEHIKIYLILEQLRFGDDLRVEYAIEYTDFDIPALTVQPIVENAVKHGATMNENGGMVSIRSFKDDAANIVITVEDNGPGFDPNTIPADGRNHFGLDNVRNCLKAYNGGELYVDSTPGRGTLVTIIIKEKRENEHPAC